MNSWNFEFQHSFLSIVVLVDTSSNISGLYRRKHFSSRVPSPNTILGHIDQFKKKWKSIFFNIANIVYVRLHITGQQCSHILVRLLIYKVVYKIRKSKAKYRKYGRFYYDKKILSKWKRQIIQDNWIRCNCDDYSNNHNCNSL